MARVRTTKRNKRTGSLLYKDVVTGKYYNDVNSMDEVESMLIVGEVGNLYGSGGSDTYFSGGGNDCDGLDSNCGDGW